RAREHRALLEERSAVWFPRSCPRDGAARRADPTNAACQTGGMTGAARGDGGSVFKKSSKARRVGWVMFPLIGVIAAAAADGVRHALAWSRSAELWRVLDPWLPTIIPAHAGYTVAPWPMHIWVSLLVALGLALATFSTVVICVVGSRPWWLRAILLWGSF